MLFLQYGLPLAPERQAQGVWGPGSPRISLFPRAPPVIYNCDSVINHLYLYTATIKCTSTHQ